MGSAVLRTIVLSPRELRQRYRDACQITLRFGGRGSFDLAFRARGQGPGRCYLPWLVWQFDQKVMGLQITSPQPKIDHSSTAIMIWISYSSFVSMLVILETRVRMMPLMPSSLLQGKS